MDFPESSGVRGLKLPAAAGLVTSVRTGQPVPGTFRVVFELATPVTPLKPQMQTLGSASTLVIEWPGDPTPAAASAVAAAAPTAAPAPRPLNAQAEAARATAALAASAQRASSVPPPQPSTPPPAPSVPASAMPTVTRPRYRPPSPLVCRHLGLPPPRPPVRQRRLALPATRRTVPPGPPLPYRLAQWWRAVAQLQLRS